MSFLITIDQAQGIAKAAAELAAVTKVSDITTDEMLHLTRLGDGSGDIRVELTNGPYKRFVDVDGKVWYKSTAQRENDKENK